MIYVQSLLAGLGALIAYVFLFVTFGIRTALAYTLFTQEH
jgi:hypothetical protein